MRQGGRAIETTQTSGAPFEGTELIKQPLVIWEELLLRLLIRGIDYLVAF